MSAYTTAYQALTRGRPLPPGEAARLLAQLRKETGDELAAAVERELSGQYRRTDTDSDASFRRKRREYGAALRVLDRIRQTAAGPCRPTTPNQLNRSTS
ncbi:hypothetical protein ACFWGL_16990 [Streptomyces sp. NPDC060286]|uniref:hypothetical protein n=1 Tax=unclassified Streptomyces TaxID=2593676 RepID=UPI0035DE7EB8